jgi:hypothetical protein
MNRAASTFLWQVIQRTFPWLVLVEIVFTLKRLPGTLISSVFVGRA